MKDYPSIPKVLNEHINSDCIAFRKYDGSQIRVEWTKKKGWHKFATRGQLFDASEKTFGCAVDIFRNMFVGNLTQVIVGEYPKATEVLAFLEFFGPRSFAGMHEPDDPKELVLFDINIHKKGILSPVEFVQNFSHLRSAEIVYEGKLTEGFIKDVRDGAVPSESADRPHPHMLDEGVVVKGGTGHKIWMAKIKTWEYLKKIQKFFGSTYGRYWE
jgi:hypothetical protein